jgi:deoxyadenosine/deoxycytidine kinase
MIDSIPLQLESRFIAVEGPVGSGKTSLARRIAEHVDGKLILEEPEKNPFLENFYKDPRSNALPTELSFLFQRSKLLESINQEELFSSQSITDFLFDKDIIFTELNLTQEEIELFQKVKRSLSIKPPEPDLVIYLQAPVDVLMTRIKMRSPSIDRSIDKDYLEKLADSYAKFFYHYDNAPVLVVNAESIDPIHNENHFNMLFTELVSVKKGHHFFNNTPSVLT